MDYKEVYSAALQNALEEMRNVCPDIQHAFIYRRNGEIVVGDRDTPEKVIAHVIGVFENVFERADAIGGIEAITLNGSMGSVRLYNFNDQCFVTVFSAKADVKLIETIVRVLIPTVLRLLEKISPAPAEIAATEPATIDNAESRGVAQPSAEVSGKHAEKVGAEVEDKEVKPVAEQPEKAHEPAVLEPSAVQLIVENIGGLFVSSDTVRVDSETFSRWESLRGDRKIEYAIIETLDGKTARCKIKPIKDSKYSGKGVVQVPEKMQVALQIGKGGLVKVKPVIE
ncbi:MAG: hypothetical protein QW717_04245 [Candidatus Bathyarchaeia archaeon]